MSETRLSVLTRRSRMICAAEQRGLATIIVRSSHPAAVDLTTTRPETRHRVFRHKEGDRFTQDDIFRCKDINLRKEYVQLVESVRDSGGDVKIFSSMHISGEQLAQLTGVAAILRFPMSELEDGGDDEDDDDDDDDDDDE